MKNAVFWDVTPCRSCVNFWVEDGGDTFLRNVGSHKIYTAPRPRRRHSSKRHFVLVEPGLNTKRSLIRT
jgi:hypothetical protein